jgi:hypothetical protein
LNLFLQMREQFHGRVVLSKQKSNGDPRSASFESSELLKVLFSIGMTGMSLWVISRFLVLRSHFSRDLNFQGKQCVEFGTNVQQSLTISIYCLFFEPREQHFDKFYCS